MKKEKTAKNTKTTKELYDFFLESEIERLKEKARHYALTLAKSPEQIDWQNLGGLMEAGLHLRVAMTIQIVLQNETNAENAIKQIEDYYERAVSNSFPTSTSAISNLLDAKLAERWHSETRRGWGPNFTPERIREYYTPAPPEKE